MWITKYRYPVLVGDVGAGQRALAGDRSESGDDDLRWGDQSGPCACARVDTAAGVGVPSRTIPKGKSSHRLLSEFGAMRKRYWGPASLGTGLLGGVERERDRRGMAKIHRESSA